MKTLVSLIFCLLSASLAQAQTLPQPAPKPVLSSPRPAGQKALAAVPLVLLLILGGSRGSASGSSSSSN